MDKIEIISEQLLALTKLWHLLLASKDSDIGKDIIEELLLEILENKQIELHEYLQDSSHEYLCENYIS